MRTFAATLAFAFAVPLLILVFGGVRLLLFWRSSSPAVGRVSAVQARDWIDDEASPVQRYFASVQYAVAGTEHTILDWGPHAEAPIPGREVPIRYRVADPSVAKVWSEFTGHRFLWLLVAVAIFVVLEFLALRVWLRWPGDVL